MLTNKHVVADLENDYSIVTYEGRELPVSNIRLDPVLDLAVLKVSDATGNSVTNLTAAAFVSQDSTINLGQFAIALGSSQSSLEFIQKSSSVTQKKYHFQYAFRRQHYSDSLLYDRQYGAAWI